MRYGNGLRGRSRRGGYGADYHAGAGQWSMRGEYIGGNPHGSGWPPLSMAYGHGYSGRGALHHGAGVQLATRASPDQSDTTATEAGMARYGGEFRGGRGYDLQRERDRRYGGGARGYDRPGYGGGAERLDLGRSGWQPRQTPVAGDLMTENPETVTPETTLADAAKKMRELNVGIIPVVDDPETRRLQGVITDRDIAVRAVAEGKGGKTRVAECMTREVEACHPDDRVRDILHIMEREQVRRVPVVDHAGSLIGIIAQADLAVDYAAGDEHRELRVEDAIERISAPARPRRGRGY